MKLINISFYNLKIVKVIYLSNIYQHLLVPASQMRDLALVGQNKVFKISMGIFLYFLTFYRANWLIDNENDSIVIVCVLSLQYLATRGYNKTLLMEEVLQRYLGDELAERKKIHEEEMKELSKSVSHTCKYTHPHNERVYLLCKNKC